MGQVWQAIDTRQGHHKCRKTMGAPSATDHPEAQRSDRGGVGSAAGTGKRRPFKLRAARGDSQNVIVACNTLI